MKGWQMSEFYINNVQIVFPHETVRAGNLKIKDNQIQALDVEIPPGAEIVDGKGQLLSPGLIDLHTHGIHKFLYDNPDQFEDGLNQLPKYGCTTVLPTIVPLLTPKSFDDLAVVAKKARAKKDTVVPGLHLEGPFMGKSGAACPTIAGDTKVLDELFAACHHHIAVMSISPEVDNILEVIEYLRENDVIPFITHTQADVDQTQAAIDAGARHATHFYDVFYAPEEYDPGVRPVGSVEAILADPRATVDFICDGIHVHPTAVRAALAAKGAEKVMLITDSNIGAGLPEGDYDTPWGFRIHVSPETGARAARDVPGKSGGLAGSALTMNRGVANLLQWLNLPPAQIWGMATINQANLLGLDKKGRIAPGSDADLVLWDNDLNPVKTWIGGKCVYEA